MILKTNCGNCQFANNSKCILGKPIFHDNQTQFVEGFCRHKRPEPERSITGIISEETNLTVIVICKDSDKYIDIIKTLSSIKYTPEITQTILSCSSLHKDKLNYITEFLKANIKTEWSIDVISQDVDISYNEKIDYSTRLVKNSWFTIIKAGDFFNENLVPPFKHYMHEMNKNFIYIYDADKSDEFIMNKHAFVEMEGNLDMPWFSKVKTFENWKNLCIEV